MPQRRLGIYFHGTNGTMFSDYGGFKIVPEGDKMKGLEPPPKSIPASPGHEREWLDCIKTRQQPRLQRVLSCEWTCRSCWSLLSLAGPLIRFDQGTEKIVGDDEAARLAVPRYQRPGNFEAVSQA